MTNDLISRSELKKAFEKWWGCDDISSNVVEDLIDNAPTVEPEKAKEGELVKAYTKGFDTGVETVRPQGEWLPFKYDYDDEHGDGNYTKIIKDADQTHWEEYWAPEFVCSNCYSKNHKAAFCPHCGAKMGGTT
jgi:hypothetical protein